MSFRNVISSSAVAALLIIAGSDCAFARQFTIVTDGGATFAGQIGAGDTGATQTETVTVVSGGNFPAEDPGQPWSIIDVAVTINDWNAEMGSDWTFTVTSPTGTVVTLFEAGDAIAGRYAGAAMGLDSFRFGSTFTPAANGTIGTLAGGAPRVGPITGVHDVATTTAGASLLTDFVGETPLGAWTLTMIDTVAGNNVVTPSFSGWALSINYNPEPASTGLFAMAMGACGFIGVRRRRKQATTDKSTEPVDTESSAV